MRNYSRRARRGIVLIWMAICGLVLLAFLGLAIDTGWVYLTGRQLQAAADAAALAGAESLNSSWTQAQTDAYNAAHANNAANSPVVLSYTVGTNDTSKDIVVGTWSSPTFTATTSAPNAVQVKARATAKLFFGPIVGVSTFSASRTAVAHAGTTGMGAGLLVLGTSGTDINLSNATLSVNNNGGIWVNSNGTGSNVAVKESNNSTITAKDLYVNGGASSAQLSGTFAGTLHTNAGTLPDPLASLPTPSTSGYSGGQIHTTTWTTATTISPGWYQKGIKVSGGTLTLTSGIYYVGNGSDTTGFDMNNTTINASSGVLLYIASGPFKLPSGSLNISPMTSGTYARIAIFQSRSNTATTTINGSASITLNGALYFPNNGVTLTGSGGVQSTGDQIIAQSISMSSGNFNLYYNAATNFQSTPGSSHVYLVK
jgi:Flp pilus assembly protein TadG